MESDTQCKLNPLNCKVVLELEGARDPLRW